MTDTSKIYPAVNKTRLSLWLGLIAPKDPENALRLKPHELADNTEMQFPSIGNSLFFSEEI